MQADIVLNDDRLELHGNVIIMDTEIDSQGPVAGYSFHDRSDPSNRFVLYSEEGKIFFWWNKVGNILTINNGQIEVNSFIADKVIANSIVINYMEETKPLSLRGSGGNATGPAEMNLLEVIQNLQDRVARLEGGNDDGSMKIMPIDPNLLIMRP